MAKSDGLKTSYVLSNNDDRLEDDQFPVENIAFTLPEHVDSSLLHVLLTSSSSSIASSQSPHASPIVKKIQINRKQQQRVSFILDQKNLSSEENKSIVATRSVIEKQQIPYSLSSHSKTHTNEEHEENYSTSVVQYLSSTSTDVLANLTEDREEDTNSIQDENKGLLDKNVDTMSTKGLLSIDSTNNKKYPSTIIPHSILRKTRFVEQSQEKNHQQGSTNNDDSVNDDSDYYIEEESEDDFENGKKRKNNEQDKIQQHIGEDQFFVQTNSRHNGKNYTTGKKKREKTREEHYYYNHHRQQQPPQLIEKVKKGKIIIDEDNAWLLKKSSSNYQSSADKEEPKSQPSSKQSVTFVEQPTIISSEFSSLTTSSYSQLHNSCTSLPSSVAYSPNNLLKPDCFNMRDYAQSTTSSNDFKPVYVSPLKYRPLVGLSAQDSRLLLEKRVSLLGKPILVHPIQRRSPTYKRTQSRMYNFLERPRGYKAGIYHTLVSKT